MFLHFNISEPKHVIKIKVPIDKSNYENETNTVVTTDSRREPSLETSNSIYIFLDNQRTEHLCAFDCTTDAGNISSRFLCLLPYPFNGKFAIGLRSKELKAAKCNHLLSLYPWIVVASIGLPSSYAVHGFIWLAFSLQRTSCRSSWLTSSLISSQPS